MSISVYKCILIVLTMCAISSVKSISTVVKRFSVAPMMAHTNRHFRFFWRLLSKQSVLFSEMVVAEALLRIDSSVYHNKIIGFDESEQPIVLQLGGRDPLNLSSAAKLGLQYGYSGINLNCGCPSGTVAVEGDMGAAMMLDPEHTAYCCAKLAEVMGSNINLSVKCRVGVDNIDTYEELHRFIEIVHTRSGVRLFQVHARKAILGIGAIKNRDIPPLQHDFVYRLANDFPHIEFDINGGVTSPSDVLSHFRAEPALAGVMVGRACINHPYSFVSIDNDIEVISQVLQQSRLPTVSSDHTPSFGGQPVSSGRKYRDEDIPPPMKQQQQQSTRGDILGKYIEYCQTYGKLDSPSSVAKLLAPTFNLFAGEEGSDRFRRRAKTMVTRGVRSAGFILREASKEIPVETLHSLSSKDISTLLVDCPWADKVPRTSAPLRVHIS